MPLSSHSHTDTERPPRLLLTAAALALVTFVPSLSRATRPDRYSPTVPTGLRGTAASCSQINLAWTASTDTGGSGLKGYNVYRNGVFVKQVLAPATSTADPGMAPATAYSYAVAALDNAGNQSATSIPVSASTPACATTTTTTTTTTSTTIASSGSCGSPTVIPSQGGTLTGATRGTSTLAGGCGVTSGSAEKVFQWTPTVSGTATVQTCGSGTTFDTVLYMRSGTCGGGAEVACNDDACANSTGAGVASRITPAVTAGQTYYIVVDGYGSGQGTFSLTVVPPGVTATTSTSTSTTTTSTTTTTTSTTTTTKPSTTTTTTVTTTTSTTTTTLANRSPVANAGVDVTGVAGSAVSFADTGSYDPDVGDAIVSYRWSFGDGTTAPYTP